MWRHDLSKASADPFSIHLAARRPQKQAALPLFHCVTRHIH
jgi:hypothetical protein